MPLAQRAREMAMWEGRKENTVTAWNNIYTMVLPFLLNIHTYFKEVSLLAPAVSLHEITLLLSPAP